MWTTEPGSRTTPQDIPHQIRKWLFWRCWQMDREVLLFTCIWGYHIGPSKSPTKPCWSVKGFKVSKNKRRTTHQQHQRWIQIHKTQREKDKHSHFDPVLIIEKMHSLSSTCKCFLRYAIRSYHVFRRAHVIVAISPSSSIKTTLTQTATRQQHGRHPCGKSFTAC